MNDYPKVSIIIPLYNRVDLVGQTLDSVINQTYKNWEAVIVDDGSTDGSFEYIQGLANNEPRIKSLQRNRKPKGASTCRNIGIEHAQGDYIIFLDSDDLLAPHCLNQRIQAFQNYQTYDFLVFPVQYFRKTIEDNDKIFLRYFYKDYLTSFILQSHWITMSPIWKKEAVLALNKFDEKLVCMQDSDLHTRALIKGMKFKVFHDRKWIDGYLRVADTHDRIGNTITVEKLDSMVYANQKIYDLLLEKNMLTAERVRFLAARFLNISWNYQLLDEKDKAYATWNYTYEKDMVNKLTYRIGRSFILVRSFSIIRNSYVLAGVTKKLYQLFLPKFLLWL